MRNKNSLKQISDIMWRVNFSDEKISIIERSKLCPKFVSLMNAPNFYSATYRFETFIRLYPDDSNLELMKSGRMYFDTLLVHKDVIIYKEYILSTEEVFNDYKLFNTSTICDGRFVEFLKEVLDFEFRFDKIKIYTFSERPTRDYLNAK